MFILNSSAQTLKNLVRSSLWSTAARDRVRGQLSEATPDPGSIDGWHEYQKCRAKSRAGSVMEKVTSTIKPKGSRV